MATTASSPRTWALGASLALGAVALQCEQLPSGYCLPCQERCPGSLICSEEHKRCVDPDVPTSCEDSSEIGNVSGTNGTNGSGGSAGEQGCSSESSCTPEVVGSLRLNVDC